VQVPTDKSRFDKNFWTTILNMSDQINLIIPMDKKLAILLGWCFLLEGWFSLQLTAVLPCRKTPGSVLHRHAQRIKVPFENVARWAETPHILSMVDAGVLLLTLAVPVKKSRFTCLA